MIGFVIHNGWNGKRPCPNCMPKANTMTTPCPKDLHGVIRIVGQVVSTGKMLWSCFDCSYQEER